RANLSPSTEEAASVSMSATTTTWQRVLFKENALAAWTGGSTDDVHWCAQLHPRRQPGDIGVVHPDTAVRGIARYQLRRAEGAVDAYHAPARPFGQRGVSGCAERIGPVGVSGVAQLEALANPEVSGGSGGARLTHAYRRGEAQAAVVVGGEPASAQADLDQPVRDMKFSESALRHPAYAPVRPAGY